MISTSFRLPLNSVFFKGSFAHCFLCLPVFVHFPVTIIKSLDKRDARKERVILALKPITVEKSWWLVPEEQLVTAHLQSGSLG